MSAIDCFIHGLAVSLILIAMAACADSAELRDAEKTAAFNLIANCPGGTAASCRTGCDGRCGVSGSLTSAALSCVQDCQQACDTNCNAFYLLLYTSR